MQSFRRGGIGLIKRHYNVRLLDSKFARSYYPINGGGTGLSSSFEPSSSIFDRVAGGVGNTRNSIDCSNGYLSRSTFQTKFGPDIGLLTSSCNRHTHLKSLIHKSLTPSVFRWDAVLPTFANRCMSTMGGPVESVPHNSASVSDVAPRIKFKRLDKTAGHIMQILDREAVKEVRAEREIPDIKPGYIIQLKVEVPENKRRLSTLKGIVIARRNAGLNSTFRLRRLVAGVGVESLFPLYSPNIKEIKILDKKKVRRAKLYYLRDKMNALKKQ